MSIIKKGMPNLITLLLAPKSAPKTITAAIKRSVFCRLVKTGKKNSKKLVGIK